jgi:hypothetical protein
MQCSTNLASLGWFSGRRRRVNSGWQSCNARAYESLSAEAARSLMLLVEAKLFGAKTWGLTGKEVARGSRQPGAKQGACS